MSEKNFYDELANWDFSKIKMKVKKLTDWDFYNEINKVINDNTKMLDIGTGGGEKLLKLYPHKGEIIATDYSSEMIKTANQNLKDYPNDNIKFMVMDSLDLKFDNNTFDVVTARHTPIDAKKIYDILKPNGVLIIQGVDKEDAWEIKKVFGRGQGYNDEIAISKKDYQDLIDANFSDVKLYEVREDEYYETKEDLLCLLLKAPIINDYDEGEKIIEENLLDEYIKKYQREDGILLERKLYGIIAKK